VVQLRVVVHAAVRLRPAAVLAVEQQAIWPAPGASVIADTITNAPMNRFPIVQLLSRVKYTEYQDIVRIDISVIGNLQ
jgi:hypothetical protein